MKACTGALVAAVMGQAMVPAFAATQGVDLRPGMETRVSVPGVAEPVTVFLPDDAPSGRKWPTLYVYPGAGMPADTAFIRPFTGSKDFIVVGVPFVSDGNGPVGDAEAVLAAEHARFRAVRQWVEGACAADPARAYLGGLSKGGWQAVRLGDLEMPRLAGLVILAAGRLHDMSSTRRDPAVRGRRIYIGVGENDANLVAACRAREYYARQGAAVTFEAFPGLAHVAPDAATAVRLIHWFQAEGRYAAAPQAERDVLRHRYAQAYTNAIAATSSPLERFLLIREMVDDPLSAVCGEGVVTGLRAKQAELGQAEQARPEWLSEQQFRDLMWRYCNLGGLADLEAVARGLQAVKETYPATLYGRLAARTATPIMESYTLSAEATRKANPAASTNAPRRTVLTPRFPPAPPRIPVPVRDGKHITFK